MGPDASRPTGTARGAARRRAGRAALGTLAAGATLSALIAVAGCGGATAASDGPGATTVSDDPGARTSSSAVSGPASTGSSVAPATTAAGAGTATTAPPLPDPSPALGPGDDRVYVLGDSVILGAKAEVPAALRGWEVAFDAKESRFVTQGITEMRAVAEKRRNPSPGGSGADGATTTRPALTPREALGRVVVIHLCTNYERNGSYAGWIQRYMDFLGDVDRVVWVTCVEWSPGQVEANQAMRDAVPRYPNAVLADWARLARTPGYSYGDGIHLDGPGRRAMADLVARVVGPAPGTSPTTRR